MPAPGRSEMRMPALSRKPTRRPLRQARHKSGQVRDEQPTRLGIPLPRSTASLLVGAHPGVTEAHHLQRDSTLSQKVRQALPDAGAALRTTDRAARHHGSSATRCALLDLDALIRRRRLTKAKGRLERRWTPLERIMLSRLARSPAPAPVRGLLIPRPPCARSRPPAHRHPAPGAPPRRRRRCRSVPPPRR